MVNFEDEYADASRSTIEAMDGVSLSSTPLETFDSGTMDELAAAFGCFLLRAMFLYLLSRCKIDSSPLCQLALTSFHANAVWAPYTTLHTLIRYVLLVHSIKEFNSST